MQLSEKFAPILVVLCEFINNTDVISVILLVHVSSYMQF